MKAKTKKKSKPAAKRKASKKVPIKSGSSLKIVNIKVGGKDRKDLNAKAKAHAKGNLSAWLRYAGLRYVPKKGEVVSLDPVASKKK